MTSHELPLGFVGFERLFTYGEAASQLNVHPRTLMRAAARGDLPVVPIGRRTVRILADDIAAWLHHCKAPF